jgi:hypothetical protein
MRNAVRQAIENSWSRIRASNDLLAATAPMLNTALAAYAREQRESAIRSGRTWSLHESRSWVSRLVDDDATDSLVQRQADFLSSIENQEIPAS